MYLSCKSRASYIPMSFSTRLFLSPGMVNVTLDFTILSFAPLALVFRLKFIV